MAIVQLRVVEDQVHVSRMEARTDDLTGLDRSIRTCGQDALT